MSCMMTFNVHQCVMLWIVIILVGVSITFKEQFVMRCEIHLSHLISAIWTDVRQLEPKPAFLKLPFRGLVVVGFLFRCFSWQFLSSAIKCEWLVYTKRRQSFNQSSGQLARLKHLVFRHLVLEEPFRDVVPRVTLLPLIQISG